MWVCHPDVTDLIIDHYNKTFDMPGVSELARASVIGKIRNDNQYIVHVNGEEIVNAPAQMVTKGFIYNRPFQSTDSVYTEPELPEPSDYNAVLLDLIEHENICSRLGIYETYDKQVQGRTIIEPGKADAGVLAPFNDEKFPEEIRHIGIAHATDHNPLYGKIDPYWCGINAVTEAMRNVAATGATPHAMTDCLCFGNPEKPEQMWEFAEATRGVADACKGIHLKNNRDYPVPIIAGNVSFYNESKMGAIPPSPIVSCLGRMDNVGKAITSEFKEIDSTIMLIGERKNELGGSAYYGLFGELGKNIPKPDLARVEAEIWALTDVIDGGLALAAHDISDGGLAVTLAEMSFGNEIGFEIEIDQNMRTDKWLFSQTGGFILEADNINLPAIISIMSSYGISVTKLGRTTAHQAMDFGNVIHMPLSKAKDRWANGLRDKLR
jgi:phosphoribosylformylglycinamidine synthase